MHIAFISYEYPPETNFGGIGTYTYQLSVALAARGYQVEVFSCSRSNQIINEPVKPRLLLHRVVADKRKTFSKAIVPVFAQRHAVNPFDIVESPEYGAEGAAIQQRFPEVPFTVKLHTPFYLHDRHNKNARNQTFFAICKQHIKTLLNYNIYNKVSDDDYLLTIKADTLSSPSLFLADILKREWQLCKIKLLPNYYKASNSLLQLPIKKHPGKVIAFIGRIEKRKGIFTVIQAIPTILKQHPDAIFRFIGSPGTAPDGIMPMDQYITDVLKKYNANIQFTGRVPANKLADALTDVSVIMIPSLFENFPYVGLESMAAGKAVIISSNSGMNEMFPPEGIKGCLMINPVKPKALSKAINFLLDNPAICMQMGINNRIHVKQFASEELLNNVVQFFEDTISIGRKRRSSKQPVAGL